MGRMIDDGNIINYLLVRFAMGRSAVFAYNRCFTFFLYKGIAKSALAAVHGNE